MSDASQVAFDPCVSYMSVVQRESLGQQRRPFWPRVVVTVGLGLTVAWVILLGYGFIRLIELAI